MTKHYQEKIKGQVWIADDKEKIRSFIMRSIDSYLLEVCHNCQKFDFELFSSGEDVREKLERKFFNYIKELNSLDEELKGNKIFRKERVELTKYRGSLEKESMDFNTLVILDHEMSPGPTGLDLAKKYSKVVPIIIYNGDNEAVKREAIKHGVIAYFSKPCELPRLCEEVANTFGAVPLETVD